MAEVELIISKLKQLHGSKETMQTISRAIDMLEKQKHKTGYWENGHCTCCGEDIASKLDTWTNVQTFSFCPKCGAEMEVK